MTYPNPGHQPPQPPAKKPINSWVWIALICAVAAVMWVGCSVAMRAEERSSTAKSTTLTTVAPVVTTARSATALAPAPSVIQVQCQAARSAVATYINNSLAASGYSLAHAQQVTRAQNGDQYIGGDIMQGDKRISSSDVWLVREDVTYSLSSDARKLSGIPDGRDLPGPKPATLLGPSAGDDWGDAVQTCVNKARRGGN